MYTIDIAEVFSKHPAGRYAVDGPFSGETFRQDVLIPALNDHDKVSIELDTTAGFGSSFLEEAFGGLVRLGIFSSAELRQKLVLNSTDDALMDEIWEYIEQAEETAA